ncbi:reverse transcriptase [Gossypium australe]|uniref:Reverse transcriptase n=1 Tax=Gossypium australe TaxID=47621 RepID=A0A5B6W8T5_9ROSI|nr:reverse transcriptase [Gossypium australe]
MGGFRFKAWLVMKQSCEEEVKHLWEMSRGGVVEKIRICRERFTKVGMGNLKIAIGWNGKNGKKLKDLIDVKIHLNIEIDKDERYWEQRARMNLLKRDNTKFFHNFASQRKRANRIEELENEHGQLVMEKKEMADVARRYFQELFSSGGISNLEYILSGIETCILESMNHMLTENYTMEEIISALKNMGPTKASGGDGFPVLFFQKYWHIVGKEVSNFCLNILNNDGLIEEIHTTNIVLIPKVANLVNLKSFRPISLCTVIYKIISKTTENLLQKVLNTCIDKAQSAFVPSRLITDNILLAYELMHSLK